MTFAVTLLLPALNGHAYLDPGSGSFILQLLIAALVGSMFIFRSSWKKALTFFRNLVNKEKNDKEE